jgi:hypothetical protein
MPALKHLVWKEKLADHKGRLSRAIFEGMKIVKNSYKGNKTQAISGDFMSIHSGNPSTTACGRRKKTQRIDNMPVLEPLIGN